MFCVYIFFTIKSIYNKSGSTNQNMNRFSTSACTRLFPIIRRFQRIFVDSVEDPINKCYAYIKTCSCVSGQLQQTKSIMTDSLLHSTNLSSVCTREIPWLQHKLKSKTSSGKFLQSPSLQEAVYIVLWLKKTKIGKVNRNQPQHQVKSYLKESIDAYS